MAIRNVLAAREPAEFVREDQSLIFVRRPSLSRHANLYATVLGERFLPARQEGSIDSCKSS
jgi:hypothetical protein